MITNWQTNIIPGSLVVARATVFFCGPSDSSAGSAGSAGSDRLVPRHSTKYCCKRSLAKLMQSCSKEFPQRTSCRVRFTMQVTGATHLHMTVDTVQLGGAAAFQSHRCPKCQFHGDGSRPLRAEVISRSCIGALRKICLRMLYTCTWCVLCR